MSILRLLEDSAGGIDSIPPHLIIRKSLSQSEPLPIPHLFWSRLMVCGDTVQKYWLVICFKCLYKTPPID